MSWRELAQIEARYFRVGDYPWTREEFYAASAPQHEAAHTVEPIVLAIFDWEGARVAESDGWWEGGLWDKEHLDLDDEWRLTHDAVRFLIVPIALGIGKCEEPPTGLLNYEIDGAGMTDAFRPHLDDIKRLCAQYVGVQTYLSILTVWECDAGDYYIPGEPTEYYSDYQLVGAIEVNPTIRFCPLEAQP
jgi:hypothetical protein